MRRYGRAVQDLLIIIITVAALALVASISINSNSGDSDLDAKVSNFLTVTDEVDVDNSITLTDVQDSLDVSLPEAPEVDLPIADIPEVEDLEVLPEEPAEEIEVVVDEPEQVVEEEEPVEAPEEDAAEVPASVDSQQYTIKEGDTYGCIAQSVYGSYENWPDIANANTGIGFEERRLFVGSVLQLPEIQTPKQATSVSSCE